MKRVAKISLSAVFVLSAVAGSAVRLPVGEPMAGAPQQQANARFLGASTCAGPACHGRAEPTDRQRSQQNEFTTWSTHDRHHQAFAVLANEKSWEIARLLKLDKPPQESDRCLNCHSMNVLEPARRGQDFKLADGVSCDGCHGPAERWLGTHLNEPYDQSLTRGMNDIRNPAVRAEMCISCHIGDRTDQKVVDHEMLAAGHPVLKFELSEYSRKLPPHWREPRQDGIRRAKLWAIGQVVELRMTTRQLAADSSRGTWPEYSHFDCSACHHDLEASTWRQQRPSPMPAGRPVWRAGPTAVFVRQLADGESVGRSIDRVHAQFASLPFGTATGVADCALRLEEELFQLTSSTAERIENVAEIRQLALRLCDAAETIAWRGSEAAEQLIFALAALLPTLVPTDSELPTTLSELQAWASGPAASSRYDPHAFLRLVSTIRAHLEPAVSDRRNDP